MRVVDDEHPGPIAADRLEQRARDAVEKARLRAGPVERGRRRSPELGDEPRRLGRGRRRHRSRLTVAQRAPHELDRAAVREAGLVLDAADGRRRRAAGTRPRDELLGEPRLADARLAVEHHEPPVRADRGVRRPAARPTRARGRRAEAATVPAGHGCGLGGRRRPDHALAHGVVRGGRLLGRRDAELAVQGADALAVLRRAPRPARRSRRRARSAVGAPSRSAARARAGGGRARSRARGSPARQGRRRAGRGRHRARARASPPAATASRRTERCRGGRSPRGTTPRCSAAACSSSARSSLAASRRNSSTSSGRPPARARPRRARRRASGRRAPSAASRASAAAPRAPGRARTRATGAPPARRDRAAPAPPRDRRGARSPCACPPRREYRRRAPPAARGATAAASSRPHLRS